MNKPIIYDYLDGALLLKAFYRYRKIREKSFSYEKWALELGITSRSYLRLVILGKRPLSDQLIGSFISNLKFSSEESEYFTLLVKHSSCKTVETKAVVAAQLIKISKAQFEFIEVSSTSEFLIDPIAPIVFSIVAQGSRLKSINIISASCNIDIERTHSILNVLIKLKLIRSTSSQDGEIRYESLGALFKVPEKANDAFRESFHKMGMTHASAATSLPFSERKFRSLIFNLNKNEMDMAQELINDFAAKVLMQFEKQTKSEFSVYRLNVQLFPVTKTINLDG